MLTQNQPYPEDERFLELAEAMDLSHRFQGGLKPNRKRNYVFIDALTNFTFSIPAELLQNPQFDLPNWYAKQRAKHYRRKFESFESAPPFKMGDPLIITAQCKLRDGIRSCYPGCDFNQVPDQCRFRVRREDLETYVIEDQDLHLEFNIEKSKLEDSMFDLVSWYRELLDESNLYDSIYTTRSLELYDRITVSRIHSQQALGGKDLAPRFSARLSPRMDSKSDSSSDIYCSETDDALPKYESVTSVENDSDQNSMPGLQPITEPSGSESDLDQSSESSNDDYVEFHAMSESIRWDEMGQNVPPMEQPDDLELDFSQGQLGEMGDALAFRLRRVLRKCQPYPGDKALGLTDPEIFSRFEIKYIKDFDTYEIYDSVRLFECHIHAARLRHEMFSVAR